MPKILRITTVPISLKLLLTGQMAYMKSKGFEVLMVSADGKEVAEVIENEECEHFVIPFTRKISPIKDFICLVKLVLLIIREKPDIVHTHTPKAGLLGMLASWLCRVDLKIHTVAGLPLMTAAGSKRKLLNFIEKLTYRCSDYVLPNSTSIYKFIQRNKFTTDHKLAMIGRGSSNGINLSKFNRGSLDENILDKVKKDISFDPSSTYLLAIGRVVKDKGITELINAFTSLKEQRHSIKLVICGPMEKERVEESLSAETIETILNHNDIIHIQWTNYVEYFLSIADVLVHASHREGFPNVLLQAGAMNCPIICSDIPGNIDIVDNKETGLLFSVNDTDDLIDKICYALDNSKHLEVLSKKLSAKIQDYYSREKVHELYHKFYLEKLEKI